MPGLTEGRAVRRGQKRRGDYSNLSKGSNGIKRQTSFKDPKVSVDKFSIKDQGTVDYAKIESVANPGAPKPYGAGKSRGGGAALRGTKFEGVF
tara:strand:+ start:1523 stop:1801 length:279 start_codon:yes stop_codon:yes gene_type:complete